MLHGLKDAKVGLGCVGWAQKEGGGDSPQTSCFCGDICCLACGLDTVGAGEHQEHGAGYFH